MSLATLADEALPSQRAPETRVRMKPVIERTAGSIAANFRIGASELPALEKALRPLAEEPVPKPKSSSALDALARFIPAETITIYVAALAALPSLKEAFAVADAVFVYWLCAALTPVLFTLVYFGKRKSAGIAPAVPKPREFPWFSLFASTIAFLVWALAVPGSAYLAGQGGKVVASFGALLVSTFLTLLEPLLTPATGGSES